MAHFHFCADRIGHKNLQDKKRDSYRESGSLTKNTIPVVAKIIDIPQSPCWIKNCPQKMATIVAKITQISRSEYREVLRIFFDSNGGNGGKKNVNNFGQGRYCIFG